MKEVKISERNYIIAVSGGVDSVVLLDMLVNDIIPISNLPYGKPKPQFIVAHFDHGIREDSRNDAKFVKSLAKKYDLPFETKREELGTNASEDLARERRYSFLRFLTKKYNAQIITAHHADDVVETILINLSRGTGWRGLAVMDSDIIRPLIKMAKLEIMNYAKKNKLTWHEDITNADEKYLRNRIRKKLAVIDDDIKRQLLGFWVHQKYLKKIIDDEIINLVNDIKASDDYMTYQRNKFANLDESVALELIRHITYGKLTRPQMKKLLDAVKDYLPSKILQAGGGIEISFTSRNFTVKLIK